MKIALISGRYDPPHPGHYATILRISKKYDKVVIVILRYNNRNYPVTYAKQQMEEILSYCKGCFEVVINDKHFAKITKKELDKFEPFHCYFAGNMKVLKHITDLGYRTEWVDRAYHYQATDQRLADGIKELI